MDRLEKLRAYISEKEGKILSANELAGILGVTISTITEAEKGNRKPSPKVARALQAKYGISPEWYLNAEGPAPWEKSESDIEWQIAEKRRAEGEVGGAAFLATVEIKKSAEHKLIEHWIRAGKNPLYRVALYNVLEQSGILPLYQELLELKRELAGLRAAVPKPDTVSPPAVTPGGNKYAGKSRPAIRLTAEPTFEPTGVQLRYPPKPGGLAPEDSTRWDRNLEVLQKWAATAAAIWVPTWALKRYCLEVHHFYSGGKLATVSGILKDFVEEGKKPDLEV